MGMAEGISQIFRYGNWTYHSNLVTFSDLVHSTDKCQQKFSAIFFEYENHGLTNAYVHVSVCTGDLEKTIKFLTDDDLKPEFSLIFFTH